MQMFWKKANHISVYQWQEKNCSFSNDNIVVKDRDGKVKHHLPAIDYLWFVS